MSKGKTAGKLPNQRVTHYHYPAEEFVSFLESLVDESKQSFRQVSLGAGLDHAAVQRYLRRGTKPSQDACIALAHYFDIHPNVMLQKAGYPPRAYFDLSLADPDEFSPEVKEVAQALMRIENAAIRRRVSEAVLRLVQEMFTEPESTEAGAEDQE
jgi:hypothetical protein